MRYNFISSNRVMLKVDSSKDPFIFLYFFQLLAPGIFVRGMHAKVLSKEIKNKIVYIHCNEREICN